VNSAGSEHLQVQAVRGGVAAGAGKRGEGGGWCVRSSSVSVERREVGVPVPPRRMVCVV